VRRPDGIDASLIYVQSNTCKNPDHRHNRGGLPYRLVAQIRQLSVSSCREVKLVSTTTGVQPHQSSARGGARRAGPRSPRDRILSSQDRFWRTNQISGPESTVQHLLAELTRADELVRVRKGLYWRGRSTPLGMSPPPVELLLSELVGTRGVGPSSRDCCAMSPAREYGSSEICFTCFSDSAPYGQTHCIRGGLVGNVRWVGSRDRNPDGRSLDSNARPSSQ
jgi:hypothetical protein